MLPSGVTTVLSEHFFQMPFAMLNELLWLDAPLCLSPHCKYELDYPFVRVTVDSQMLSACLATWPLSALSPGLSWGLF
eukprot:6234193-Amphidinium_carterae.1